MLPFNQGATPIANFFTIKCISPLSKPAIFPPNLPPPRQETVFLSHYSPPIIAIFTPAPILMAHTSTQKYQNPNPASHTHFPSPSPFQSSPTPPRLYNQSSHCFHIAASKTMYRSGNARYRSIRYPQPPYFIEENSFQLLQIFKFSNEFENSIHRDRHCPRYNPTGTFAYDYFVVEIRIYLRDLRGWNISIFILLRVCL